MVRITKPNNKPMIVSQAAYEGIYKPAGWLVSGKVKMEKPAKVQEESEPDYETDDWDSIPEDEESEKSLSEMSMDELRYKAETMGIDVTGITTARQMREKIKRHM